MAVSVFTIWRNSNRKMATVKRLLEMFESARKERCLNWETINALEDHIGTLLVAALLFVISK